MACATQPAVGCAVVPRMRIRRLACSMTARMYWRCPVRVAVSMKSQASSVSAWERRKSAQVVILRSGAGDEDAYGADGGRASGPPGSAGARVTPMHQVAVPAQDGVRSHQQPQAAQHLAGQGREKGGEEGPVLRREPHPIRRHPVGGKLSLQDGDLMPERQDLHVLVPVPHRQQPQRGERVRDSQIGQAQQHESSSCRVSPPL
jgi:hypothetical protein